MVQDRFGRCRIVVFWTAEIKNGDITADVVSLFFIAETKFLYFVLKIRAVVFKSAEIWYTKSIYVLE